MISPHTRLFRSSLLPLIGLSVLGLTGCRTGGGDRDDALVRLINAAPEADDLSVSVDGQRMWKHASFRSNSGFEGVGEGTYQVDISADVNGQRRTGSNYIQCRKDKSYTVVALSPAESGGEPPALRIFTDDRNSPVPMGRVRVRFINAGTRMGAVDVLFNNIVGLTNVPFGRRSAALLLEPGAYDVRVNAAEDVTSLIGPASLHFLPGHSYTLIAMGRRGATGGSQDLSLETYPDEQ